MECEDEGEGGGGLIRGAQEILYNKQATGLQDVITPFDQLLVGFGAEGVDDVGDKNEVERFLGKGNGEIAGDEFHSVEQARIFNEFACDWKDIGLIKIGGADLGVLCKGGDGIGAGPCPYIEEMGVWGKVHSLHQGLRAGLGDVVHAPDKGFKGFSVPIFIADGLTGAYGVFETGPGIPCIGAMEEDMGLIGRCAGKKAFIGDGGVLVVISGFCKEFEGEESVKDHARAAWGTVQVLGYLVDSVRLLKEWKETETESGEKDLGTLVTAGKRVEALGEFRVHVEDPIGYFWGKHIGKGGGMEKTKLWTSMDLMDRMDIKKYGPTPACVDNWKNVGL